MRKDLIWYRDPPTSRLWSEGDANELHVTEAEFAAIWSAAVETDGDDTEYYRRVKAILGERCPQPYMPTRIKADIPLGNPEDWVGTPGT